MTCAEIITILKDILVASAAAITASVAVIGLKSWKKELTGKAEFDTAMGLLKSTYKLRDGMQRFREPFISAGEFPNGYMGSTGGHSDEETGQAYAKVYGDRWVTDITTPIQEFDAHTIEAEALWGVSIKAKCQELRSCVGQLRASQSSFIRDKYSGGRDFEADREYAVEVREAISAGGDENPLTIKINDAIDDIEETLRPHLQRS